MEAQTIKHKILQLTGMTVDEYSVAVYDLGIAFACYWMRGDDWGIGMVTGQRAYWKWWEDRLEINNEVFIMNYHSYDRRDMRATIKELWFIELRPENINTYPNIISIDQTYAEMLDQITKNDK